MICHITIRTSKLHESVEFYQWLFGFPISMQLQTPFGEIIFLGNKQTKLELIGDEQAEKINASCLTIGIAVNDLDEKITMLDEKGIAHSKITSPMPNTRFLFFTDLNGCEIQLCEDK